MFPFRIIRCMFNRQILFNRVSLCASRFGSSIFSDRHRRELLEKFDETNAQVFNHLKETYFNAKDLDWNKIRSDLIKEYPRIYNQFNFEVQFMQHLLKVNDAENHIIQSFINHVKQLLVKQNNKVVLCHLIRFLLVMDKHPDVDYIRIALESISKDENFIKYPVVGKAWAEFAKLSPHACKQSIDFALKHHVMQTDGLIALVLNTLKNEMFIEAENLLHFYPEKRLTDEVVEQWFNSIRKLDKSHRFDETERLVKVLENKRYLIQKAMLKKVENFLTSCGYYLKPGIIDVNNCSCKVCGSPLQTIKEDEVKQLHGAVETHLINKFGEIYIVSTPDEVDNFNHFMDSHSSSPFDLVIDGLNVSYYNTSRTVSQDKETHLLTIKNLGLNESLYETMEINNIFDKFAKILVIGRKHMASWPSIKKLKAKHSDQVWVYLLDNKSEDDVFTINAAIRSSKTYIWTADFLRQYKELLGTGFIDLFEKWKYCRQIRFAPGSKRVLEFPSNVDYVCQSTSPGHYHFPINMNVRIDSQERISAHWICIKPSSRL